MRVMELHAPLRVVQRSQGRTATAAAAYRAAARIECERTGQVHDYTRKRGVEHTEMHAAPGAPAWALDRQALWNAAEMREKHPRAQTAREIEIGFPHEFSVQQRREAGRKVAGMLVARYGSAVDIAWHSPGRQGDQRNYHAHILFTGRAVTADGWAANKRNALDDRKTGPDELKALRAGVAGILNDIAARDKLKVCVEHLSFEDRGLDREATQHMGPDATEMERRGERSDIGDKNRAIEARNAEREQARTERDNVIDFVLARDKYRRRNPWETFYLHTQHLRAVMVQQLDAGFGQQEREARSELRRIRNEQDGRNIFTRLWSKLTGRTTEENARVQALSNVLSDIERKRLVAHEQFEADRRRRLEELKNDIAARERHDQEQFVAALRRQQEEAVAMHYAALEEQARETREEKAREERARQLRLAETFHKTDQRSTGQRVDRPVEPPRANTVTRSEEPERPAPPPAAASSPVTNEEFAQAAGQDWHHDDHLVSQDSLGYAPEPSAEQKAADERLVQDLIDKMNQKRGRAI